MSASHVVISLLSNCDHVSALLTSRADVLGGGDLINLTTSTPAQVSLLASAARQTGMGFLHGVIEGYPADIGAAEAVILLGGDEGPWQRHQELLRSIAGQSTYMGDSPAAPCVLDTALAGCLVQGAHAAFLESTAFATRAGVDVDTLRAYLPMALEALKRDMVRSLDAIAAQDFLNTQANLYTYARSFATFKNTVESTGCTAHVLEGCLRRTQSAIAAGDGELGFVGLVRH